MAQQSKIGKTATRIFKDGDFMCVQYHDIVVVKFNQEEIVLNSGGWWTNTTKTRMNQASRQFNLGIDIYAKNFQWYVRQYLPEPLPFTTHHFNSDVLTIKREK